MPVWLVSLWAKIQGYVIAVGAVLALIAAIFFKGKSAGRADAVAKQQEIDNAARERIKAVKPADSATTVQRLRDGEF